MITFQQNVNSITLNLDRKTAICLYTNKNIDRSKMIASRIVDSHIKKTFMPNFEQESVQWQYLGLKNDQKFSDFRSVLN